ncbi:MAG: TetR/AcrR family transcriptional regulator [Brevibacterium aurantiacum]|uniref:TetR/AcrR family transcriptional regulator n=1 Tax=Brevibacterium aurantiacum TaxID=273384 RepID=A0A2H1JUK4_BREAU|nr:MULTISPECIES: TetR/AcrR family transcriptional regulator [Brevibacterium]MDN5593656.1 TetR/AcrR family transcriptional regulator [Brevibacterium sp.]AZL06262.1 TetR/AcrR family transcriptional regulator [Brevibacterium aurantiacum]AZL13470.1 TetR/AcrR family transcriptional regulator [Brevibacterium aurantiacum]AZT93982.1 TetR/AcrR family transcriptional regulator [Brevibacterium aurantiacum]AZT97782.1 TetR/AcrR family transcriptional regulator [Brevibacterium aurantiacum]
MTNSTPRQRARLETEAQITRIGNRMLDDDGLEGVSLRAIARELGIVSSAIYRYVKNRDELLTILIRDAFTAIADEVDEALTRDESVLTVGVTMLAWSRRHPNRWALIYGTPIPDYQAPRDETVVPGTRIMVTLTNLLEKSSAVQTSSELPPSHALDPLREGLRELGLEPDDQVIVRSVTVWAALVGLINALRFGQFGPGVELVEDELMRGVVSSLGH